MLLSWDVERLRCWLDYYCWCWLLLAGVPAVPAASVCLLILLAGLDWPDWQGWRAGGPRTGKLPALGGGGGVEWRAISHSRTAPPPASREQEETRLETRRETTSRQGEPGLVAVEGSPGSAVSPHLLGDNVCHSHSQSVLLLLLLLLLSLTLSPDLSLTEDSLSSSPPAPVLQSDSSCVLASLSIPASLPLCLPPAWSLVFTGDWDKQEITGETEILTTRRSHNVNLAPGSTTRGQGWELDNLIFPSLPVYIVGRYVFLWSHKARGECQERCEIILHWSARSGLAWSERLDSIDMAPWHSDCGLRSTFLGSRQLSPSVLSAHQE